MLEALREDWLDRPTHRRVWALATPMILSNLTVPMVALVDSAVAGHLPHASQLGAVAVGSAVYTLPVWACGFLRMGTIGFTAQAAGRDDGDALRRILLQSLLLGLALAVVFVLAALPLTAPLLTLMKPSAQLDTLASQYLHIRLLGLPAALANYALAGWFLGSQDARVTLRILLATNLVNIALNLLFVPGLGWGVPGIATASVLGEWSGTVVGLLHVHGRLRHHPGHLHIGALRRWTTWKPLIGVNRDILIRSLALEGVFFTLTTLGSRIGDDVVAANTLLLNGLMLTAFALDGLANAVEALAGHAIGSARSDLLRRALCVAGGWSLLGSLGFAALFALGGHLFVDLQTSIRAVRTVAYAYLPYLAVLPLVGVWSYLLDGLFVGATRAREMRDGMIVAMLAFVALAAALHPLGNHGLWLAFLGFMLVRALVLGAIGLRIARRGGWVRHAP